MDKLLDAILDVLQADGTLTALVSANNIRVAYQEESLAYPSIVIMDWSMNEVDTPTGMVVCTFPIVVYSQTNNLNCIEIHNQIETVLDRQETSISNSDCKVHIIRRRGGGRAYWMTTRTWRMDVSYYVVGEDVS